MDDTFLLFRPVSFSSPLPVTCQSSPALILPQFPIDQPPPLTQTHYPTTSISTTMADQHDDDLAASKTQGFKVGEKKTLQEYQELGESFPLYAQLHQAPAPILTLPLPRRQR